MNDQHPASVQDIQIIGAGFTGMLAAFLLSERGHKVTVVDASDRPGGLISTLPHPRGDIETAANGFMSHPLIERVAETIGVRLVPASEVARKKRFIWSFDPSKPARETGPLRWPLTVGESIGMGLRIFWNVLTGRMAPHALESLEHWGIRTLGAAATEKVLSAAVLGIYASPPSQLSASLVVGRFFAGRSAKGARRPRSRKPRLRGTVAPEQGMGEWFSKLRAHLESKGVEFLTRREPELDLPPAQEARTWICTSAPEAARLTRKIAPELSRELSKIRLLPIVTVSRFSEASPADPSGFGCLFHLKAGFNSLGVLWSSDIFPHRFKKSGKSTRAETWILKADSLSDAEILEQVETDRRRLSPNQPSAASIEATITRWPEAFPLYDVALERTLATLPKPPEGIVLCGNYLGRLGLSQIALQVQEKVEALSS
jgi:oxygen-dependent protoporphyrinogen oxidase